jgi:lysophospholipase L1-like esterase
MSIRKQLKSILVWFTIIFLPLVVILLVITGFDLYLHKKYESTFGLNTSGYRGTVLHEKKFNEYRIAALGGSTTFGYGVNTNQSWPFLLESNLNSSNKMLMNGKNYRVVNLGYNNEGAFAYEYNLREFNYLNFDAVIFFTGVNDLGPENLTVFRNNPIFNIFGYFPLLPIVLFEKAKIIGSNENIADAYLGQNQQNSNFLQNKIAQLMLYLSDNYQKISPKIDSDYQENSSDQNYDTRLVFDECGEIWLEYCGNILSAIKYAKKMGLRIFVISEPNRGKNSQSQKKAINKLINKYNSKWSQQIVWLDYTGFLNLQSDKISFDKMHLTPTGNKMLAEQISQDLNLHLSK